MRLLGKIKRKIYKLFHPVIGDVLMLHRVVTIRSVLEDNRLMEVTPEFLEETILNYQKSGYEFISLDQLYERRQLGYKSKKKFVCFTFDDGYVDNYSIAYPIFKKYNCPFAIYVTTDFPEGKALMWWYVLEEILLNNNSAILGDGSEYLCDTLELKNQAFKIIREKIFLLQDENLSDKLAELFIHYQYSFTDILKVNSMTWNQIIELSKDPICTIASHSVSHAAMDKLNATQVKYELQQSKKIIEEKLNKEINHFAYPYGRMNDNVRDLVAHAAYKTALMAAGGSERIDCNLLEIKRLTLIFN